MRILFMAFILAVTSATQPASRPSTQMTVSDAEANIKNAQANLDTAAEVFDSAKKRDLDALKANDTDKKLTSDVAGAKDALDNARSNGTIDQRLAAGTAYNNARDSLKKFEDDFSRQDKQLVAALDEYDEAKSNVLAALKNRDDEAKAENAQRAAQSKASEKSLGNKVEIGMSIEDARKIIGSNGTIFRQDADDITYEFTIEYKNVLGGDMPEGADGYLLYLTIEDGKISDIQQGRPLRGSASEATGGSFAPGGR